MECHIASVDTVCITPAKKAIGRATPTRGNKNTKTATVIVPAAAGTALTLKAVLSTNCTA